MSSRVSLLFALGCLLVLAGAPAVLTQEGSAPMPVVEVSRPVEREVADCADFTGRTEAVQSVQVQARASGYLVKILFKEGGLVKAGDVLYEIDPRPYQAEYDVAAAKLQAAEVRLQAAAKELERAKALLPRKGISQEDYDRVVAAHADAEAQARVARAELEVHKLQLAFTRVVAPIAGQIGRTMLDVGNLVRADQTTLTTIVSLDPMYVYFDIDEGSLLRMRRAVSEGKVKPLQDGALPLRLGLQGEAGFPHKGTLNFVNNQVNPNTGAITARGVLDNPRPEKGPRLLSPGMFVRVRLPLGGPRKALLVPEQAVGSDQGKKFVYVVNKENVAVSRPVRTGALHDGLRVIEEGLKPDEFVIVNGLARVRPGLKVEAKQVPVPEK
jgi:multidrug efflux system membrane fusion protein